MKKLTEMQQSYVDHRAQGLRQREAAVAAGYSAPTADKQASALERREDIKKAIAKARKSLRAGGVDVPKEEELTERQKLQQMPREKYADPIDFLTDLMNHKHHPVAMRMDAAKQLLPYTHARIAEKGKKESKKDRAAELSGGGKVGSKPKFATKRPPGAPNLHVVGGKG